MLILRILRSLTFNSLMWLWTVFTALLCIPFLIAPRITLVYAMELWAGGIMFLLRYVGGIKYEIRGRENLPDKPALIALKHQSMWDTIILHLLIKDPVIILKKELAGIPVYGWIAMRLGMIAVDRDSGASALKKMVQQGKQRLAGGQHIAIFPEGTRAEPGEAPDYKPGIAALYKQLDVNCVPVALNSGLYWGRRSFTKHSGTIVIDVLPPIPPGLKRKAFMERLENDIETATANLVAEAKANR
ncbi:MAG: lysophospholipid acyltransferase family protein [Alphaproteobacteria bacterium]